VTSKTVETPTNPFDPINTPDAAPGEDGVRASLELKDSGGVKKSDSEKPMVTPALDDGNKAWLPSAFAEGTPAVTGRETDAVNGSDRTTFFVGPNTEENANGFAVLYELDSGKGSVSTHGAEGLTAPESVCESLLTNGELEATD
jgi:hypothetical protein